MDFIIENWYVIFAAFVVMAAIIIAIVKFFKDPKTKQLDGLREWLLYATTVAEKELGSGTGKLKLRFVYDLFVTKFPWLAKTITFNRFSDFVDDTLGEMNTMLASNNAARLYVNGTEEVPSEAAEG